MNALRLTRQNYLPYSFALLWILTTLFLAWLLLVNQQTSFKSIGLWAAILTAIPCNVALMNVLKNPIYAEPIEHATAKGKLVGWVVIVIAAFVVVTLVFGKRLFLLFPVIAAILLLLQKQPLARREWGYAAFLALIASAAGVVNESITFIAPLQWGLLQFPLTLFGFLLGWSILRRTGLLQQGVGQSRFLIEGAWPAARSFLLGALLSMPWALGMAVLGNSEGSRSTWVHFWWQPLVAFNPGIAEEAWARFMFVPLAFLLFRRVSSNRTAFSTALIVMAFLFAFMHTPGSGDAVEMLLGTLIGVIFILPIPVICFYRDLETAIGFHFWMDFVKFLVALVLINR